ncbi:MAG TPA: hypothetical protein VG267_15805 [Terracidiphilus sp.]|jgi:hypothetical protein|nr:hypothetical protein [Terracidiphilus sp.]
MADALYLSLWYPNLRLAGLADKLVAVLGEFALHGGEARVYAVTVWPVSWSEAPVFQRVWGRAVAPAAPGEMPVVGAEPRAAVAETVELLHEDYAYEFQIGWSLWEIAGDRERGNEDADASGRQPQILRAAQDDNFLSRGSDGEERDISRGSDGKGRDLSEGSFEQREVGARWARVSRLVRVTGLGPLFDEGAYEQDGHIRIDFGSDAPFLEEEAELDAAAVRHVAENIRQLVDLTAAVEKASGATARLLWSELGESLAQRLAQRLSERLGQGN